MAQPISTQHEINRRIPAFAQACVGDVVAGAGFAAALLLGALVLWYHYGTAVFFEMIASGIALLLIDGKRNFMMDRTTAALVIVAAFAGSLVVGFGADAVGARWIANCGGARRNRRAVSTDRPGRSDRGRKSLQGARR